MENKSWAYKIGYICGCIGIAVATLALSSLIIAAVIYIIRMMF